MERAKAKTWIEYAGGIAVLVGLLLVVIELRQSNQHAKAESIRDIYFIWQEIYQYESEYEIDLLITKAITSPNELTHREMFRLDDYYSIIVNALLMRAAMQREGGLVFADIVQEGPAIVSNYFYYPVARGWFLAWGTWVEQDPPFYESLKSAIDESVDADTEFWTERWLEVFP